MPFKAYSTHPGARKSSKSPGSKNQRDWGAYNKTLKKRGDITVWLSPSVAEAWYLHDRTYEGHGAPQLYSDMAILTVHEIRQVFRLPLRQCECFVNALFSLMTLDLCCPSFSTLSKRLKTLGLSRPHYRYCHRKATGITNIAIDSTGLKCYGQDEWALEKHGEIRQKRQWRKWHVTVDEHHIIQTSELTDRKTHDMEAIDDLMSPIMADLQQVTGDTAYDANKVYASLTEYFPNVDVVIPPKRGSMYHKNNARQRNRNVEEIQCYGRKHWQSMHAYGNRNKSECAIGRYKRILGNKLHAREFVRQQQESLIGCSILNKMMSITLGEVRQKS